MSWMIVFRAVGWLHRIRRGLFACRQTTSKVVALIRTRRGEDTASSRLGNGVGSRPMSKSIECGSRSEIEVSSVRVYCLLIYAPFRSSFFETCSI